MGRPAGTRNRGYEEKREALAQSVGSALIAEDGSAASFRQLASAAGVSVPTLRHYFGDHDGTVAAGLQALSQQGAQYVRQARDPGELPVRESIHTFLTQISAAWQRFGVGRAHAAGLVLGLKNRAHGPEYLEALLEPTLQAVEARIAVHQERGELRPAEPRVVGLALMGPVILALLHQNELYGSRCRPLELESYLDAHVDGWLRGYAVTPD